MSMKRVIFFAPALRQSVVSQTRQSANFYTGKHFDNFREAYVKSSKPAEAASERWKKIFFFVSVPCLFLGLWLSYREHKEHHSKPRPEYIAYPYLNVRNKPFPWGDGNHTFFHNPAEQYVPGVGYEKEREHH